MQNVPIQALPSQSFSVPLDNNQWDITIRTANGVIAVTLVLNGVTVIENMRAVGGMRIIPDQYQENGNFVFVTQNFQVPDYTQFGISQKLIYLSAAELEVIRQLPPEPLRASDFDPNAALPLRLFPQGYVENGPMYVTESGLYYVSEDEESFYVPE